MSQLSVTIQSLNTPDQKEYAAFFADLTTKIQNAGYTIVESNTAKPWGAYFRIDSTQADMFVGEFFPDLDPLQARLGVEGTELCPKILVILPGHRFSWQFHNHRAERWRFLTPGWYRKSIDDDEGERFPAQADDVVQFLQGERHRLEADSNAPVIVAEIWQPSSIDHATDEDDIVRVADDYSR
jgi:mannose-6-phosphate isomerase-like protein (cupin superfamily)